MATSVSSLAIRERSGTPLLARDCACGAASRAYDFRARLLRMRRGPDQEATLRRNDLSSLRMQPAVSARRRHATASGSDSSSARYASYAASVGKSINPSAELVGPAILVGRK